MAIWNPWRGRHRCSKGCQYCYIHKGDLKRGVDTEQIVRTKGFDAPVQVKRDGACKMKGGQTVYLCFSTDFLLEDADPWREECWDMIRRRPDLHFLFLTKRIHRFAQCIRQGVHFEFRQCGAHFIKDGKTYTLPVRELCGQAKKANINW